MIKDYLKSLIAAVWVSGVLRMLRAGLDGCADGLADGRLTTDSLQITRAARTGSGRWPAHSHGYPLASGRQRRGSKWTCVTRAHSFDSFGIYAYIFRCVASLLRCPPIPPCYPTYMMKHPVVCSSSSTQQPQYCFLWQYHCIPNIVLEMAAVRSHCGPF